MRSKEPVKKTNGNCKVQGLIPNVKKKKLQKIKH